ncbi:MAG: O-antigen ligase family protein [Phaeovulum sp.]|uniref:O-antigen ligase family protein n=1 Tax=Phaeovulum sp. TaxID=2934796 RepID=UPI002735C4D3|nr:O-antigen ligase family protein [Phaeovulum sp.]MDP3860099.1 O-antigen ligase family protein [Phaeovulum sp.]
MQDPNPRNTKPAPTAAKTRQAGAGGVRGNVAVSAQRTAAPPRLHLTESNQRRRRLNTMLAIGLVAIVLVAPLPVGSNRGAAWMLWAMVLGAGAALYFTAVALLPSVRPFRALMVRRWLWLVAAVLVWGLVQYLPIAGFLPRWIAALPETGAPRPASLSLAPGATFVAVLRGFTVLLFFILMIEVSARLSRARTIGWTLFFGVAFYALWSLLSLRFFGDSFFWGTKTSSLGAATGPFVNRNSFATFLGIGAVLGLALMLERARLPRMRHPSGHRLTSAENIATLFLDVVWLIVMVALVATQSRMGLVSTVAGLGLVWVTSPNAQASGRRAQMLRWSGGVAAVAVIVFLLAFQGEAVISRFFGAEGDLAVRTALYAQVIDMIATRPLTGFGLDAFQPAFELYHRLPVSSALIWDKTHSTYLALWVELGLVFGTLPMIAAAGLALRLVQVLRRRHHDVALVAAALAALLTTGIHSLVDFSLEMQANQFLLLAVLALGVARRGMTDNLEDGTAPIASETPGAAE